MAKVVKCEIGYAGSYSRSVPSLTGGQISNWEEPSVSRGALFSIYTALSLEGTRRDEPPLGHWKKDDLPASANMFPVKSKYFNASHCCL